MRVYDVSSRMKELAADALKDERERRRRISAFTGESTKEKRLNLTPEPISVNPPPRKQVKPES